MHTPAPVSPADFVSALSRVERDTYVMADAYTHAPLTPYAPIPGRLGIRADVARKHPGLTALPVADVAPAARARFANTLDGMADIESRLVSRYWDRMEDPSLSEVAQENMLARANRAAAESDRLSDRSHHVRAAV